jgi:hypothetical protein
MQLAFLGQEVAGRRRELLERAVHTHIQLCICEQLGAESIPQLKGA